MIEEYIGFTYCITNVKTNRKYVGKKGFTRRKTFQKNNKKKRKLVMSDWKNYYGSSEELKADIKEFGKDNFRREIIRLCKSKSEMNYYELHEQMVRHVMLKPLEYYNSYVGTRINRNQLNRLLTIDQEPAKVPD